MMSMEVPTYLDTGSPHNSTPTSPSFALSRQPHLKPPSRPATPAQSVSLEPPSGTSFIDFLRGWNDLHVARWLTENKCGHHAQTFANNDIRSDILLDLDQQTLREMGITSVGDRVKILNGVKGLRAKCSKTSARNVSQTNALAAALPVQLHTDPPLSAAVDISINRAGHKRLEQSRPPPLHLTQTSNRGDLPVLVRNDSRENTRPLRPLPLPQGPTHTHTHSASSTKDSNGVTRGLPPLPPPPRVQPPPAPGPTRPNNTPNANQNIRNLQPPQNTNSGGRRTPTPMDPPPSFTQNPLPPAPSCATPSNGPSPAPWSGDYGLPRGPSPGNLVRTSNASTNNRSTSPLPPQRPPRPPVGLQGAAMHSRTASASTPSSHPYASGSSQGSSSQQHASNAIGILTPIQENFVHQHSTATGSSTPSPPTAASIGTLGITSSREQLRPTTPSTSRRQMSAEDIRRRCVKFILADDGHSRLINVEDIPRGTEILEFVLKKFGKSAGIGFPSVEDADLGPIDPNDGLVVGGWGVFLDESSPESPGKHLSETELLLICHDEHNSAREHGLTLRRVTTTRRSKQLTKYFGESPLRDISSTASQENASQTIFDNRTTKQKKRASTISILSGLGVPDPERALAPPMPDLSSKPASPTPSMRAKTQSKLHNFHGHRPPSELITNHLQEYFPYTEKKVLERTHRQSMMFRNGHPDSIRSGFEGRRFSRQSWMPRDDNRGSTSSPPLPPVPLLPDTTSIRSMQSGKSFQSGKSGLSVQTTASQEPPRMSISTEDGHPIDLNDEPRISSTPHLLPPVKFPTETETLSETMNKVGRNLSRTASNASRTSRRTSLLMDLRNKRDRSDTASMLTVDEITQEVESRRASLVAEGKDPESMDEELTAVESEGMDEEDDEETMLEEVEDADDEGEGEGEGEEEENKVADPDINKRRIKWIKGALIGAGSFGSVYLGMNSHTGLLMAVKQVELPTGSAPNEERKKSMLSALEREIELLKELQHDNIVQYLDSFSDGVYLNIFLEYVPGGSVATLLKNYGAFEEALVRNFVRQILQGLNYLHERDIIHRDIKGGNILVDNKGGIKISDFGISKKVEDSILTGARMHRPSLQGSVFWMAPEVVKQTSYTLKADIWSVGCLVVEMLTGEHPWAQLTQMQAIFKIGSLARPACPSDVSANAEDFLNKTFELDHSLRPSAAQLLLHTWAVPGPC